MIYLKNKYEIEKLYCAGQIVKDTLFMIEENIKPGVTTLELDRIAEEFILSNNALPGFKGLYGFPCTLCISIDDEIVHGLPSKRELKMGEIVSIDVGSIYDDYYVKVDTIFSGYIHQIQRNRIFITDENKTEMLRKRYAIRI